MTPSEQIRHIKQWLEEERAFEKALDEALFWALDQEQQRLDPQAEHPDAVTDDTDGSDRPGLGAATAADGDPAGR